ncbi:MAG: response regulator [Alphaproteobacteria bacterium]|nr:response regulator [Alphaproteobacteria bacterium]
MSIKITDGLTLPEVLDPNTVYVVYVDDEVLLGESYTRLLQVKLKSAGIVDELAARKMNIEVVSFHYSVDALEMLKDKNLHRVVILSDNNMPEINGTELISRLREVDSEVPVALLSALPRDAEAQLPDNVKSARVFSKPNSDASALNQYLIPNILAAAEKPALPAVQQQAGAAYDLARK